MDGGELTAKMGGSPQYVANHPHLSFLLHVDCPLRSICCCLTSSILYYCTVILLLVGCFHMSIFRLLPSSIWPFLLPSSVHLLCITHIYLSFLSVDLFYCDYPPPFFCHLAALICQLEVYIHLSFLCIVFPVL
jgi:hypothetical protein